MRKLIPQNMEPEILEDLQIKSGDGRFRTEKKSFPYRLNFEQVE